MSKTEDLEAKNALLESELAGLKEQVTNLSHELLAHRENQGLRQRVAQLEAQLAARVEEAAGETA